VNVRTFFIGLLLALAGTAVAAGTYWALLNVPESNVPALLLSAVLVLLLVGVAACTVGAVLAVASGTTIGGALRRAPWAIPGFVLGLLVCGALWWITTAVDSQWTLHRGEIDAVALRYVGTARTAWVHTSVAWLTWLVRWGIGTAMLAAATAGSVDASVGGRGALRSLAHALAPVPLLVTLAALIAGRALWSLAYWRPRGLTADTSELAFVSVKLGVLLVAVAAMAVVVLHVFARATAGAASANRAATGGPG
jgi:hypothetical protein